MKRLAALAGGLLLALTISSCGATTGPVGTWGDGYNTDKQPYLELALAADQDASFEQAGFISGSDGCNRLSGQWFYAQGELKFQNLGGTLMQCEGVDTWLSKAATAKVDGDTLTVHDATGAELGTLDRRN
ncbi:heat shock protein HslJ [Arthrobacter stackebrandtii]|uniref:Heat shock protein HslJ n=1 Tax=Arthrobacter stackebrandtii TaxID=272161 RepID=A0ABS4YV95_9MICC|nr:META domain-containing protein [Arthrobacter stackebrandtii]MBP2412719.1 heat shock protein HslJ [Arthrobacter stackebrandtii]PYG99916.1 META domain-containing protein [Arthrobacter stackebrandtii]